MPKITRRTPYVLCLKTLVKRRGEVRGNSNLGHGGALLGKGSTCLLSMLNNLTKTSKRIFPTPCQTMASIYWKTRQRIAQKLQNPRFLKISFTTFRHWGGTIIAHYTKGNVLTVKKLLRHKAITSTMKYIGMINFKDDEFEVTTATTVEEAKTILAAGYDYITKKNSIMLFRKPKRFKV